MKKTLNISQKTAISVNAIIRILLPLWIFMNPAQGALIAILTDCLDFQPLVHYFKIPRVTYELQDKYLDLYWYLLIVIYTMLNPVPEIMRLAILVAFGMRMSGMIVFTLFKKEAVLIIFPNVVEPLFWLWLIYPKVYEQPYIFVFSLLIIFVLKILHEYVVHKMKYSPIDHLLKILRRG